MNKILLVDGHSIAYRAFYGQGNSGSLNAPDGTPTGAIYAFLNMFMKYYEQYNPSHIAVLFDTSDPTFRTDSYVAYKANRESMPEDLVVQMPFIHEILNALNVKVISKAGFEADDLIGTLAKRLANADNHVYILSGDRDDLQLIDENISQIYPHQRGKTTLFTPAVVKETYKLEPKQIIDLKALMGDSSDNIPGVKGIGEKTASKLLLEYSSLENIYANIDSIKGAVQKKLIAGEDFAKLSYELATIDTNVDIVCELDDLLNRPNNNERLSELFLRLGFASMIDKFKLHDVVQDFIEDTTIEINAKHVSASELLKLVKSKDLLAFNLTGLKNDSYLNPKDFELLISDSEKIIYVLDHLEVWEIKEILEKLLSENIQLVTYDFKPISKALEFFPLSGIVDLSVAAYLLDVEVDNKTISEVYTSIKGVPAGQAKILADRNTPSSQKLNELYSLTAKALTIAEEVKAELIEKDMYNLALEIEFPLTSVLAKMEQSGINVEKSVLNELSEEFSNTANDLARRIYLAAGHEFNINSPKQLADVLFLEMKIPTSKKTATGNYSTSADVLEELAAQYPIVDDILEYRKVTKLQSTFTDGLALEIKADGKIHSSFHQKLTATGRLSSSNPNLQNIPSRDEIGRKIRKAFVPSPGYTFIDADYSQIELRLLAILSKDENLLQAFKDGKDIHNITASGIFGVNLDDVNRLQRTIAKTINFSIVYGISDYGLSQDLRISVKEARDYIQAYHDKYPKVQPFMDTLINKAKDLGYAKTDFSRRRNIPELKDKNFNRRKFGERVAMNAPIQGTAADLMKLAMIRTQAALNKSNIDARILVQVHDELLLEVKDSQIDECSLLLKEAMEGVAQYEITLESDINVGQNWYECK